MLQVIEDINEQELIFKKSICQDIHCDPKYVQIYNGINWGRALFFHFTDSYGFIAFPFYIFRRELEQVTVKEVRSIYGYTSFLFDCEISPQRIRDVVTAFFAWCDSEKICAGSLVLDPQFNEFLVDIPSKWLSRQKSVFSLDSAGALWNEQKFCRKAAADARHFFKSGDVDLTDGSDMDILLFHDMYRKTMDRVDAADRWYWPREYWEALGSLGHTLDCKFAVARKDDKPCLISLFIGCDSTYYYHFSASQGAPVRGASSAAFFRFSEYAFDAGARRVHLGGGVSNADNNPLARFKKSLSNVVEDLYVLKILVDEETYLRAGGVDDGSFFPRYEVV
jgi:hypothetical protein